MKKMALKSTNDEEVDVDLFLTEGVEVSIGD